MKKYTDDARKALEYAETISLYTGNVVESVHLLVGITENKHCYGAEILSRLGFDFGVAKSYLIRTSLTPKNVSTVVGPTAQKIIDYAESVSNATDKRIDTHHLLLAISYHKTCSASKILQKNNIGYELLLGIVEGMNHNGIGARPDKNEDKKTFSASFPPSKEREENENPLTAYGTDLTEKARRGKLDKIIGRDKEIDRLIRILSRKRKNNPIIVGESGVGKTAIVEALAQKIADGDVPEFLKGKSLISLNLNSIVAGTKYRGEMEEKLDEILKTAEEKNIILFIDELHTVVSAGNSENGGSVSSALKPAINNENLMLIGATTFAEYSRYLGKDPAFERRFMKVVVEEPTAEKTVEILSGIRESFENHYRLKITDDALECAVRLSVRYVSDRFLPDKAIDVLDEACSKVALSEREKEVTPRNVRDALTEMTGIPVNDAEAENLKILDMEKTLNERIIGQEEVVSVISKAIIRSKAGLREGKKPIGSFIFLGTTGSGKTETAKALAEILFGSEDALIRFDMSEYMEKNSVARLIGSPPGYVGHEEGGTLTESVKNKPYSIVLFDEIEKANPEIFNVLLQVLDDGRLTDGRGRTTDFRNTLIIMTSNAGTEKLEKKKSVGFGSYDKSEDEKELQISALKSLMRPEFINRVDNIVVFNRLNKENLSKIAEYILERKKKILFEERGIKIDFADGVADYVAEKAYEPGYGARPIRRAVENLLENSLSEVIIEKNLKNTEISVAIQNGKPVISDKQ